MGGKRGREGVMRRCQVVERKGKPCSSWETEEWAGQGGGWGVGDGIRGMQKEVRAE